MTATVKGGNNSCTVFACPPIYGYGDTLHCQKAAYISARGHFALPKGPIYLGMATVCTANKPPILYMGMGTLCTAKKSRVCGHGDALHYQKAPYIWAWGHVCATIYTSLALQSKIEEMRNKIRAAEQETVETAKEVEALKTALLYAEANVDSKTESLESKIKQMEEFMFNTQDELATVSQVAPHVHFVLPTPTSLHSPIVPPPQKTFFFCVVQSNTSQYPSK